MVRTRTAGLTAFLLLALHVVPGAVPAPAPPQGEPSPGGPAAPAGPAGQTAPAAPATQPPTTPAGDPPASPAPLPVHPDLAFAQAAGRVRFLLRSGAWREGLAAAKTLAAERKTDPRATAVLGEALYRAGRLEAARAALEPLVTSPTPPPRALMALGMVRVAEGRDDEGMVLLERAAALDPADRDILFWAAGAAPTRADGVRALERYLALSEGDDPDRIDGARGTIALYKALGERKVWVPRARPERFEVPLRAFLDRHHKTTGYLVEVTLGDGKPVRLLLDTGSTGLFLLERIAKANGFAPIAEQTTFAGGGEGRSSSERGILATLGIGELTFGDALVSTTREEIEPTGRYHGLLSLTVFQGYTVTLDLAHERLIAERETRLTNGSPYWTVASQMLVEAGTDDGAEGLFLFDTGSTRSLLSLALAQSRYGKQIAGDARIRGYGGLLRGGSTVLGVRVRYQGRENLDPYLNAADLDPRSRLSGVEVAGYLGLDILDRTKITVDTVSHRVLVARP